MSIPRVLLSFAEAGEQLIDGAHLLPRISEPWNLRINKALVPLTGTGSEWFDT